MGISDKVSAGLLMYSNAGGRLRVFLAHPGGPFFANKDEGWWGIPKGEVEPGENLLDAAVREFHEETGVKPEAAFIDLGFVYLKSGKQVHAWAFAGEWSDGEVPVSNTFALEWPPKSGRFQHFPEIDRVGLFTLEEARAKINQAQYPFIDRLLQYIKPS